MTPVAHPPSFALQLPGLSLSLFCFYLFSTTRAPIPVVSFLFPKLQPIPSEKTIDHAQALHCPLQSLLNISKNIRVKTTIDQYNEYGPCGEWQSCVESR